MKSQPVYELYEWEKSFREIMFGGLGVIKFILDEDTLTYACRNLNQINPQAYGEAIDRFIRENRFKLTPKEWGVLNYQTQEMVERFKKLAEGNSIT